MAKPFIVLEGIDNSGKSTISRKLAEILKAQYIAFPDRSSETGKEINDFLKKSDLCGSELNDQTNVSQNHERRIKHPSSIDNENTGCNSIQNTKQIDTTKDNLSSHKSCLNKYILGRNEEMQSLFSKNRYEKADFIRNTLKTTPIVCDRYWISGAVYSTAKGLNYSECKKMDSNLPMPDYTFFLDVPPEICSQRQGFGEEAHDDLEFQRMVYQIYKSIDENMIFIKNAPIDRIIDEILERINGF